MDKASISDFAHRISGYSRHYTGSYWTVQRDKRTPLWFKQLYAFLVFFTMLMFLTVVLTGTLEVPHLCTTSYQDGINVSNGMKIMMYVFSPLAALYLLLALYTLIKWKWMWMHSQFTPTKQKVYGEDIEDIDPGFLARSGARSFLDATSALDNTKHEVERAHTDLDRK